MAVLENIEDSEVKKYDVLVKKMANKKQEEPARLSSRASKGSLSVAKSNYSKKENDLFNKIMQG